MYKDNFDALCAHVGEAWGHERIIKGRRDLTLRAFLIDLLWSVDCLSHQLGLPYEQVEKNRLAYAVSLRLWQIKFGKEPVPLPEIPALRPKVIDALRMAKDIIHNEKSKQPKDDKPWAKHGTQGAPCPIEKERIEEVKPKTTFVVGIKNGKIVPLGAKVALTERIVSYKPIWEVEAIGLRPPEMRKTESVEGRFVPMPASGGIDWSKPSRKSTETR